MERLGQSLVRVSNILRHSSIRTKINLFRVVSTTSVNTGCATYHTGDPSKSAVFTNSSSSNGKSSQNHRKFWKHVPVGALAFSLFGFGKKEEIDQLNLAINTGRREAELNNFDEADKLYHKALKILDSRKENRSISEKEFIEKRTFVFDCLANLYFMKGDVRSGEALYKETLKGLFASGYEQSDNSVVEISVKLANVYAMQKRHAEAQAGYKFCIETQEEKFDTGITDDDTLALWGLCIDSYARYLVWTGDFKKSFELFQKALQLSIKIRGASHEQTLVILNSLATVAVELNDLDAAEKYLKQAIAGAEENHYPQRAAFYVNLAGIYFQKKQFDKALELGKNALKVAIEVKDKESEEQANLIVKMMTMKVSKNPL